MELEIATANAKIEQAEEQLEEEGITDKKEARLERKIERLCEEVSRLRKKEEQLRDEKKHLMLRQPKPNTYASNLLLPHAHEDYIRSSTAVDPPPPLVLPGVASGTQGPESVSGADDGGGKPPLLLAAAGGAVAASDVGGVVAVNVAGDRTDTASHPQIDHGKHGRPHLLCLKPFVIRLTSQWCGRIRRWRVWILRSCRFSWIAWS